MIRKQSMLLTVTVLLLCIAAGSLLYYTLVTQTVYEESVLYSCASCIRPVPC